MCEGDLVSLMFLFKVDGLSVFVFLVVEFRFTCLSLLSSGGDMFNIVLCPSGRRCTPILEFRVDHPPTTVVFFFTSTITMAERNAEQMQITYNVKRKVSLPFS